jgi:hypothetical protein
MALQRDGSVPTLATTSTFLALYLPMISCDCVPAGGLLRVTVAVPWRVKIHPVVFVVVHREGAVRATQ